MSFKEIREAAQRRGFEAQEILVAHNHDPHGAMHRSYKIYAGRSLVFEGKAKGTLAWLGERGRVGPPLGTCPSGVVYWDREASLRQIHFERAVERVRAPSLAALLAELPAIDRAIHRDCFKDEFRNPKENP